MTVSHHHRSVTHTPPTLLPEVPPALATTTGTKSTTLEFAGAVTFRSARPSKSNRHKLEATQLSVVAPGAFWSSWHHTWASQGVSTICPALPHARRYPRLTGRAVTQQAGNAGRYQQLLPGHQAAKAGPGGFADEEPHHGVRDGIPHSAHKEDDGGIESVHLQEEELGLGNANSWCPQGPS